MVAGMGHANAPMHEFQSYQRLVPYFVLKQLHAQKVADGAAKDGKDTDYQRYVALRGFSAPGIQCAKMHCLPAKDLRQRGRIATCYEATCKLLSQC